MSESPPIWVDPGRLALRLQFLIYMLEEREPEETQSIDAIQVSFPAERLWHTQKRNYPLDHFSQLNLTGPPESSHGWINRIVEEIVRLTPKRETELRTAIRIRSAWERARGSNPIDAIVEFTETLRPILGDIEALEESALIAVELQKKPEPKKPGRHKTHDANELKRIYRAWKLAHEEGISKAEFAEREGLALVSLRRMLDSARKIESE